MGQVCGEKGRCQAGVFSCSAIRIGLGWVTLASPWRNRCGHALEILFFFLFLSGLLILHVCMAQPYADQFPHSIPVQVDFHAVAFPFFFSFVSFFFDGPVPPVD